MYLFCEFNFRMVAKLEVAEGAGFNEWSDFVLPDFHDFSGIDPFQKFMEFYEKIIEIITDLCNR